jgi:hypothetical protein
MLCKKIGMKWGAENRDGACAQGAYSLQVEMKKDKCAEQKL